MSCKTYVIGAGVAGLAAATRLAEAGRPVALFESAPNAGGRCRSLYDDELGCVVDNGNHLVLSGNKDAMTYLERIGAQGTVLIGDPSFPFVDVVSGMRWTIDLNDGPIPWWILSASKRIPGTKFVDYWRSKKVFHSDARTTVYDAFVETERLYERFWKPFSIAVLNTSPEEASATLLIPVIRETLAKGGNFCRPVFTKNGLGSSFVDPAVDYLRRSSADVHFGARCSGLGLVDGQVKSLQVGGVNIELDADDTVVLALPPTSLDRLLPEIVVPSEFRPIVNAHFTVDSSEGCEPITGMLGSVAEWLFVRNDVASVTVSAAVQYAKLSSDELGRMIWAEIAPILGKSAEITPPFRIIKEKRATIAQTPEMVLRRPRVRTLLGNTFLAGDWTDTGLPATIEGAIRSGHRAASCVLNA